MSVFGKLVELVGGNTVLAVLIVIGFGCGILGTTILEERAKNRKTSFKEIVFFIVTIIIGLAIPLEYIGVYFKVLFLIVVIALAWSTIRLFSAGNKLKESLKDDNENDTFDQIVTTDDENDDPIQNK